MRLLVAIAVLLLTAPAATQAAEGDIIVVREPGSSAREIRADAGVRLVKPLSTGQAELVKPRDGDVAQALADLRADDAVLVAEQDRRVTITGLEAPTDPFFGSMWGLRDATVPDAWRVSSGTGVTVGVVDTGVASTHPDLVTQLTGNPGEQGNGRENNGIDDDGNGFVDDFRGWDFVSGDNLPQDANGHGTHVSGTIAAAGDNGIGVIGVAPGAKILPLRALDETGAGAMSTIGAAFDYAGKLGVRVVNASLSGGYSAYLQTIIARYPKTLFVAAAGNSSKNNDNAADASYPCAMTSPNVLCVAAHDRNGARAIFSNYGATSVDLSAPGVDIVSTWLNGGYASTGGTSMASPHVAGAAADILAATPAASTAQLKWALLSSVTPSPGLAGTSVTGGRLNTSGAIAAITGTLPADPTPTPTPEPPAATPEPPAPPVVTPPVPTATPEPVEPTPAAPVKLTDVNVGGSLKGTKGKLRVSFKLTRSATVRFTVAAKGKQVATWTKQAHRGGNQFQLTRKLPTGRTLKRGAYTLSVAVNASAKTSTAIRVP